MEANEEPSAVEETDQKPPVFADTNPVEALATFPESQLDAVESKSVPTADIAQQVTHEAHVERSDLMSSQNNGIFRGALSPPPSIPLPQVPMTSLPAARLPPPTKPLPEIPQKMKKTAQASSLVSRSLPRSASPTPPLRDVTNPNSPSKPAQAANSIRDLESLLDELVGCIRSLDDEPLAVTSILPRDARRPSAPAILSTSLSSAAPPLPSKSGVKSGLLQSENDTAPKKPSMITTAHQINPYTALASQTPPTSRSDPPHLPMPTPSASSLNSAHQKGLNGDLSYMSVSGPATGDFHSNAIGGYQQTFVHQTQHHPQMSYASQIYQSPSITSYNSKSSPQAVRNSASASSDVPSSSTLSFRDVGLAGGSDIHRNYSTTSSNVTQSLQHQHQLQTTRSREEDIVSDDGDEDEDHAKDGIDDEQSVVSGNSSTKASKSKIPSKALKLMGLPNNLNISSDGIEVSRSGEGIGSKQLSASSGDALAFAPTIQELSSLGFVYCGFFKKKRERGAMQGRWTKRFGVLVVGKLYMFQRNDPKEKPVGLLAITPETTTVTNIGNPRELTIEIKTPVPDRNSRVVWTLLMETEDDIRAWDRMISSATNVKSAGDNIRVKRPSKAEALLGLSSGSKAEALLGVGPSSVVTSPAAGSDEFEETLQRQTSLSSKLAAVLGKTLESDAWEAGSSVSQKNSVTEKASVAGTDMSQLENQKLRLQEQLYLQQIQMLQSQLNVASAAALSLGAGRSRSEGTFLEAVTPMTTPPPMPSLEYLQYQQQQLQLQIQQQLTLQPKAMPVRNPTTQTLAGSGFSRTPSDGSDLMHIMPPRKSIDVSPRYRAAGTPYKGVIDVPSPQLGSMTPGVNLGRSISQGSSLSTNLNTMGGAQSVAIHRPQVIHSIASTASSFGSTSGSVSVISPTSSLAPLTPGGSYPQIHQNSGGVAAHQQVAMQNQLQSGKLLNGDLTPVARPLTGHSVLPYFERTSSAAHHHRENQHQFVPQQHNSNLGRIGESGVGMSRSGTKHVTPGPIDNVLSILDDLERRGVL